MDLVEVGGRGGEAGVCMCVLCVFRWEDEKRMIKKRGVEERWMIIVMREGRADSQCPMLIWWVCLSQICQSACDSNRNLSSVCESAAHPNASACY